MQSAGYDLCLVGKSGDPVQIGSMCHKTRYHDAEKERVLAERIPHLQAEVTQKSVIK